MEYHHFNMETLQTAITLMHPQCWFASIDLKDAYFSVNVCEMDRIFLRNLSLMADYFLLSRYFKVFAWRLEFLPNF